MREKEITMRKYWIPIVVLAVLAVLAVGIKLFLNNIYIAAQLGNAARITKILEKHPELINTLNSAGLTPLHYAASGGHVDAVKALLAKGADVETERIGGCTALHDAIFKKHKDVAELLTSHGAKIHGEMSAGYKDIETFQLLLDIGADVNKRDKRDMSPLDGAASLGNTDVLRLLLEHDADVNAVDEHGRTALHWAAGRRETEAAELLIENGATIDAKNEDGLTPLCFAILSSQLKVAEVLLKKGADVHIRTSHHRTLLHVTASKPKPWKRPRFNLLPSPDRGQDEDDPYDIAKLLIKYSLDVNARDGNLRTPLHGTARFGITEVADLLLEHGANVNAKDEDSSTPLHEAVISDNVKMAKLLLENGADLNIKSNSGTPFELARSRDNKEIVELFSTYEMQK